MKKFLVALLVVLVGSMVFSAAEALARPRGSGGRLSNAARQAQKQQRKVKAKLEVPAQTQEQAAEDLDEAMKTWGEYLALAANKDLKDEFEAAQNWSAKLDALRKAAQRKFKDHGLDAAALGKEKDSENVILAQVLCMTDSQMKNLAGMKPEERAILARLPSDLQKKALDLDAKGRENAKKEWIAAAKANVGWDSMTASERTQLVNAWNDYKNGGLLNELRDYAEAREKVIAANLAEMEKLADETGYSKSSYGEFMQWFSGNPVLVKGRLRPWDGRDLHVEKMFDGSPVFMTKVRGMYAFMGRGYPTVRELAAAEAEANEKGEKDKGVLFKDDILVANINGWELDHNADYLRLTLKEWDEAFVISKGESVIKKDIDKMAGKGIPNSLVKFTYTNYYNELVIIPEPGVKGYITIGTLNDNSQADDDAIAGADVYFDGSGEPITFSNKRGLDKKHNPLQTYFNGGKMYDIRVIRGDVRLELEDGYIKKNLTAAPAPGFSANFEAALTSSVNTGNPAAEPGRMDTDPRAPFIGEVIDAASTPLGNEPSEIMDDAAPLWDGAGDWMIPVSSLPATGEGNLIALLCLGLAVSVITTGASAMALRGR